MSRSLRRGALAASAIAFSLASLSACAAGNGAQTLGVKADNAYVTVGDIKVQNATVVTQPKPDAEGPAVVAATLFNNGKDPQTLDSVQVGSATVKLSPGKGTGPITVPAHGSVVLGGKGNASAVIANGREAAKNGDAAEGHLPVQPDRRREPGRLRGPGHQLLRRASAPASSRSPRTSASGAPSARALGRPVRRGHAEHAGRRRRSGKPAGSGAATHSATTTGH